MQFRNLAAMVLAIGFATIAYAHAHSICPSSAPPLNPLTDCSGNASRTDKNAGKVTAIQATSSDPLQAGVGVVDITPTTFPVALAGPPSTELATRTDTRLYVKALVFSKGGQKVAIVTLDSYKYELLQANHARHAIATATGIPISNIIISASETHRAPFWSYYPDQLVTPSTQAVTMAVADLGPVKLAAAKGESAGVSENRRVIKDGTTWAGGNYRHHNRTVIQRKDRSTPRLLCWQWSVQMEDTRPCCITSLVRAPIPGLSLFPVIFLAIHSTTSKVNWGTLCQPYSLMARAAT